MNAQFNVGHNRKVAGRELTIDEFRNHRTSSRSSDLIIKSSDWRKNGLRFWLHTKSVITTVWSHQMFKVIESRDDKEQIPIFFKWNCQESEDILVKRYKRDRAGNRLYPPEACPFCKMGEIVRDLVVAGKIHWTDVVLKFEGDDRKKTKLIRAGDFYGAFSSNDLSEEEIADVRREGAPSKKEAWATNLVPSVEYLFVGADDDNLSEGCRLVYGPRAIGEQMGTAISKKMRDTGSRELGDPFKHPYIFEWTYDERAKKNKYDVATISRDPTPEVLKIIRTDPPADTSDEVAWGDADELRTLFEAHMVVKLPLDKAFPPRDRTSAQPRREDSADEDREEESDEAERYDCDFCGVEGVMADDDVDCPKCGVHYEENENGEMIPVSIPCTQCKTLVELPAKAGDEATCPKCGAKHHEEREGEKSTWFHDAVAEVVEQPPVKAARRVRGKR